MVGEEEVSLRVWDTSGQEKYRPIVGYHLQECQLLIFMYDLTDLESKSRLTQPSTRFRPGSPASRRTAWTSPPRS